MKFSAMTKILSLALAASGFAFANNIVVYNIVSNTNSTYVGTTRTPVANTIQYQKTGAPSGQANKLVGTNIGITDLARVLPNPNLGRLCIGCALSFTTGTLSSYQNVGGGTFPSGFPQNPQYTFNQGGTAVITGGVDLNNNGILDAGDIPAGSVLMSGAFIGAVTVKGNFVSGDQSIAAGIILNSQNTQLNQFLFHNPFGGPIWTGQMNITFNPFGPRAIGSTNALPLFNSRQIINGTFVNSAVPEPGSILLFSSVTAVLGIGLMRRRRAQQQNTENV